MADSCPYCFEALDPKVIAFRCLQPQNVCEPLDDDALQEFLRVARAPRLPPVSVVPRPRLRGLPRKAQCRQCGYETAKVVCARCHNQLPAEHRFTDGQSVALVGAKGSGKSHLVAVLVNEIETSWRSRFGLSLGAGDEATIRRQKLIRQRLFDDGVTLEATARVGANADLRYPLAFQLRGASRKAGVLNLVFYDTAGEDLENAEALERDARYVVASDAVVMLLDPLQIPFVREQLPGAVLPPQGPDPLEIVTRVTLAVRVHLGLPADEAIALPLALAFSKVDAVRGLMDPASPALVASPHRGGYDEDDGAEVSESVRAHVHEWAGPRLDNFVQANWATHRWFAVSALGQSPVGTKLAGGLSPTRVDDPLLWLASRWGTVRRGVVG